MSIFFLHILQKPNLLLIFFSKFYKNSIPINNPQVNNIINKLLRAFYLTFKQAKAAFFQPLIINNIPINPYNPLLKLLLTLITLQTLKFFINLHI